MSIIYGTTNTKGTGGASNLTTENGTEIDLSAIDVSSVGSGEWTIDSGLVTVDSYNDGSRVHTQYTTIANTGEWNDDGVKELYIDSDNIDAIDTDYHNITIENFVDVSIHLDTEVQDEFIDGGPTSNNITVVDAKRGDIDLGDHATYNDLTIISHSNGDSWSNLFTVNGSDSISDKVTFTTEGSAYEDTGSEYTEFVVDLNGGNDIFTYAIDAAVSDDMTRSVDGGDGTDTLVLDADSSDLNFSNFEVITSDSDDEFTVTLSEDILVSNSSSDDPLTITNLNIDFADDYQSISATQNVDDDSSELYTVTVEYDDGSYTFITDNIEQDWITS